MKKYVIVIASLLLLMISVKVLFFQDANKRTRAKLELIKTELRRVGMKPKWVVISGKRYSVYNNMLSNSKPNSQHLKGSAIDIFVFDINGDGTFDYEDTRRFIIANQSVEREHPDLKGAVGTYLNKKGLSRKMIHVDTRGESLVYKY